MQWKEKGREGRACARVLLLPPPTTPATTNLPCSMDLRRQALDFGFAPNPSWAQSVFWADYNQSCFLPSHCDSSHHKETNERACNICAHTTRIQKSGAVLAESRIYVCAHTSRMQYTTRIQNTEIRNRNNYAHPSTGSQCCIELEYERGIFHKCIDITSIRESKTVIFASEIIKD